MLQLVFYLFTVATSLLLDLTSYPFYHTTDTQMLHNEDINVRAWNFCKNFIIETSHFKWSDN